MIDDINFGDWNKSLLVELIEFFRRNHPEEFKKVFDDYEELLRGN